MNLGEKIHETSIIFDAHCDTLLQVVAGKRRLTEASTEGEADLPRLRQGGVTAQVFAIFIDRNARQRSPAITKIPTESSRSIFFITTSGR